MRRVSICLIATTALAMALPAAAQQPPRPNAPSTSQQPFRTVRPDASPSMLGHYQWRFESAPASNIPAQPLERVDLANRVSTLIDLGRCSDARAMALEAGDRVMALRVRQQCRADREAG